MDRTRDQIRTVAATVDRIISDPDFAAGLAAVRRGQPFDWRIDSWAYERGRLFGCIAPLDMPLRIGGKLNPRALHLAKLAFERKLLI